jgi:hypothetical protein
VTLSRNDIDKIRQLIRRVDKLESQTAGAEFNTHRGSDHFLVVAPEGGIPAFVDPVPGQALCNMVRRFSNDPPEDKELSEMGTKQLVYNLGAEVVAGKIVIAHRDAFGDLFLPPNPVGMLIPLLFEQTGGEDVCPAEWTYTVSHAITGEELGTAIDPTEAPHMHTRPDRSLLPATTGLGFYDASGTFVIWRAYEELAGTCGDCDCPNPIGGEGGCDCCGTACLEITVAGIANTELCENCGVFNRVYSIPSIGEVCKEQGEYFAILPEGSEICDAGEGNHADETCELAGAVAVEWIIYKLAGAWYLRVFFDLNGSGRYSEWEVEITYANCVPTITNPLVKIDSDDIGACDLSAITITAAVVECAP